MAIVVGQPTRRAPVESHHTKKVSRLSFFSQSWCLLLTYFHFSLMFWLGTGLAHSELGSKMLGGYSGGSNSQGCCPVAGLQAVGSS